MTIMGSLTDTLKKHMLPLHIETTIQSPTPTEKSSDTSSSMKSKAKSLKSKSLKKAKEVKGEAKAAAHDVAEHVTHVI